MIEIIYHLVSVAQSVAKLAFERLTTGSIMTEVSGFLGREGNLTSIESEL